MSEHSVSKPADERNTAVTLSYLLVEAEHFQGQQNATARLYANGTQKSTALITLVARNAFNEVVTLPPNTSIEIIPYGSFVGLWPSDGTPPAAGFLPFDESLPGLIHEPVSTVHEAATKDEEGGDVLSQTFRRYIRNVNNPAFLTEKFAVQVTLGTTVFRTNHLDVEYGGNGENGRFNSSFQLRSVEPTRYTLGMGGLHISDSTEVYSQSVDGYTAKVLNYKVALRHPATGRAVAFHASSNITADSSHNGNKATAFGAPGSAVSKKNIPATPSRLASALNNHALSTIMSPSADRITVAVGMWSRVSERFATRQTSYCRGAVDVYGNPVNLRVELISTPVDEGRDPWKYSISIDGE
ncbi:hypothetical protein [Pseudomonas chlororaphis]|uniref:hypothetical protein n=1 Tax=Pseudomonas chlororaphis TaxID=587753 RepID=UPI0015DEE799|nr:hypothetical protein [Pseudomonas chlororaphis]QLL10864.1 hypothetical protein H0I86_17545 [Pseudomonas chlororaphis subsp. aurantiaca]